MADKNVPALPRLPLRVGLDVPAFLPELVNTATRVLNTSAADEPGVVQEVAFNLAVLQQVIPHELVLLFMKLDCARLGHIVVCEPGHKPYLFFRSTAASWNTSMRVTRFGLSFRSLVRCRSTR